MTQSNIELLIKVKLIINKDQYYHYLTNIPYHATDGVNLSLTFSSFLMNVSLLNSIKNNERIEHEYVTNRVYSFDTDFIYSFTFHQLFEEAKKIETIVEFARFIIRNMLLLYQIDHFILSLTSTKDKAYTYILGDVAKIKESIISAIKLDIPITTDNSSCVIDDDIISQLIVKQMKTKEAYEDWQLSLQ